MGVEGDGKGPGKLIYASLSRAPTMVGARLRRKPSFAFGSHVPFFKNTPHTDTHTHTHTHTHTPTYPSARDRPPSSRDRDLSVLHE